MADLALNIKVPDGHEEIVTDALNETLNALVREHILDDPDDDAWKWWVAR